MSCKPIRAIVPQQTQLRHFRGRPGICRRTASARPADVEMARVLKTAPFQHGFGPVQRRHRPLEAWRTARRRRADDRSRHHDLSTGVQRLERRTGKSVAIGTARPGVVTIIPAGSSSRWDIPGPVNVVQLYLPHTTLERVAGEADTSAPGDLLERTGHPDPITSRLLMSAADAIEGNAALDALFRHQLTDLLATRLLAAHAGSPTTFQPTLGGLSPNVLRRAIERLRSDSDADVSLAALASDAGLSRFHFCRAFKESTGLSPHAWLRQHRLEQAMNMLRDTDDVGRLGRSGAWLRLPNRFRCGVQEADRRDPERLAEAHALAAIALQVRQSLWGSRRSGPARTSPCPHQQRRRQTMIWKNFVGRLAITSRRRGVATAVMYGLSLTVRFTSATGEEVEIPPQAAQSTHPMISIMTRDGSRLP